MRLIILIAALLLLIGLKELRFHLYHRERLLRRMAEKSRARSTDHTTQYTVVEFFGGYWDGDLWVMRLPLPPVIKIPVPARSLPAWADDSDVEALLESSAQTCVEYRTACTSPHQVYTATEWFVRDLQGNVTVEDLVLETITQPTPYYVDS